MQEHSQYLNVDLKSWVLGTAKKVEKGMHWNISWQETYREIGGKKPESGKKGCPMKAAETLYKLGRIRGCKISFKPATLKEIRDNYSKNGVYAVLAIECLNENPNISSADLWNSIRDRFIRELGEEPATSEQGGPTVAYKLWHLGMIIGSGSV